MIELSKQTSICIDHLINLKTKNENTKEKLEI